jgi:hypothetical protein
VSIMNAEGWLAATRTSYDTVAAGYDDQVRDALAERRYRPVTRDDRCGSA